MVRPVKVSLHVGPHRTATTYIQYAAFQNRAYLAGRGIQFINMPAQSTGVAHALNELRPDIALAEFDRLSGACSEEFAGMHPAPSMLYSSEVLFEAELHRAAEYKRAFAKFVSALEARGHAVELVFVERDLEDILTSNALLQVSLGNLAFVTRELRPHLDFLTDYTWKKLFYFDHFKVVHLSYGHLAGGGDLFANFMKLAFGLDLPELSPIDPAIDARNATSDAQIAKGMVLAPVINWLEEFGSLSRFELFNASFPVEPPMSAASKDAMAANASLLRDVVRAAARKALEMFALDHAVEQPTLEPRGQAPLDQAARLGIPKSARGQ
jgi:hypothetical protein